MQEKAKAIITRLLDKRRISAEEAVILIEAMQAPVYPVYPVYPFTLGPDSTSPYVTAPSTQ